MESMALDLLVVPVVQAMACCILVGGLATAFARLAGKIAATLTGGHEDAPEHRGRPSGRSEFQIRGGRSVGHAREASRPLAGVAYRGRIA